MTIQDGYNSKETTVQLSESNGTVSMVISHSGMEGVNETLVYLTVDELLALFLEVKSVGRDLFC